MISVKVWRDENAKINHILVRGHAEFDVHGKDIVCAGVSAVVIGIANSIERIFGIESHQAKDAAEISCRIPSKVTKEDYSGISLLLEAMFISLLGIAEQFPEYIQIEQ